MVCPRRQREGAAAVLFNSFQFVVFFAIALVTYWALRNRARLYFLLAASYVFYGSWDYRFLTLLVATTLIDYAAGRLLDRVENPRRRRVVLGVSLGANLTILGFFKYYNFFVDSLTILLGRLGFTPHLGTLQIILPVGVSFYTFQSMSYTIDVYRRDATPSRDLVAFATYVAFFPQLVAGPIERYSRLYPQIVRPASPSALWIRKGLCLVLLGYFKKVVIADGLAPVVDAAFARTAAVNAGQVLEAGALFACQVYGDFSGYSSIASGVAYFFGVELMHNFRAPYLSRSISEYWRRWHVSLSTWFRDYVYVPLGGSRTGRTTANLIVTMVVAGLWHGAAWKYVAWGGLHGCLVAGERRFAPVRAGHAFPLPTWRTWPIHLVWQAVTFGIVAVGLIVFRAASLPHAWMLFGTLASLHGIRSVATWRLALSLATIVAIDLPVFLREDQTWPLGLPLPVRVAVYTTLLLAVMLLSGPAPQPFIYFAF